MVGVILLREISLEDKKKLVYEAVQAQKTAYAPYSGFKVGAALLFEGGEIVSGCNVENSSFGATICAERNAMTTAVALGLRKPLAAAVVGIHGESCAPCGACRQVLAEFNEDMEIILQDGEALLEIRLSALLPMHFSLTKNQQRS